MPTKIRREDVFPGESGVHLVWVAPAIWGWEPPVGVVASRGLGSAPRRRQS